MLTPEGIHAGVLSNVVYLTNPSRWKGNTELLNVEYGLTGNPVRRPVAIVVLQVKLPRVDSEDVCAPN